MFDDWINTQVPSPRWTPLIPPEETLADDLLSGNASPAIQTPLANSGNITPDDDNQTLERDSVDAGTNNEEENANESMRSSAQPTSSLGGFGTLPPQPGSRGGHQIVIDSSSQVSLI